MARSTKSYEERLLQLEKREQESLENTMFPRVCVTNLFLLFKK